MRGRAVLSILLVASLIALAPSVPAQGGNGIKSCGEGFELFIRNPDIMPRQDGRVHIAGDTFVQFQVIGEDADLIETFAFSVGLGLDNPEEVCDLPYWPTGTMLEAYKADDDKTDGFFILMNTKGQTTPQNTDLTVAVHAYDGGGAELARFWSIAVVESCAGPQGGCPEEEVRANDKTVPWPIILPGDGEASLVPEGFTVEFPEELSNLTVLLNNQDITDQLVEWEGRQWDRDTYYDHGYMGLFGQFTPPCSLPDPLHTCGPPDGPAYEWTKRAITDDDIIRVVASDMSGNQVKKEIHIGSSVAGGAIADGLPVLQMTFDETTLTAEPGSDAIFTMTMQNTGGGEGHPFASADVPAGWASAWVPGHQPVPAGGTSQQELHVTVSENATPGDHPVRPRIEYRQGAEDKSLEGQLTVRVVEPSAPRPEQEEEAPADKASPAIGILPLLLLGLVAARIRKRT